MHAEGYKIVTISDIHGAIHNANGLNIPQVMAYLGKNKTLEGYTEAEQYQQSRIARGRLRHFAACGGREPDYVEERR